MTSSRAEARRVLTRRPDTVADLRPLHPARLSTRLSSSNAGRLQQCQQPDDLVAFKHWSHVADHGAEEGPKEAEPGDAGRCGATALQ